MERACRTSMSSIKKIRNRSVYWWTKDLTNLRRECRMYRRRFTRARRRKNIEIPEYWRVLHKSKRKELRKQIMEAKKKTWSELLAPIDEDPWGRPYKIVTGKLRALIKSI